MDSGSRVKPWWWAVALVVAAAVIWLAVTAVERGDRAPVDPSGGVVEPADTGSTGSSPGMPATGAAAEGLVERTEEMRAAVRRYEAGCAARLEPVVGEGLGGLMAECIERLSAAVDGIVASDTVGEVAIADRLDGYRQQVERLETTPPGAGRAEPTRDVLRSITELLAVIRAERYPESLGESGAVDDLRSAIAELDPDRPLDEQRHPLRRFFMGAGGLLSAMARPGDPGPGL